MLRTACSENVYQSNGGANYFAALGCDWKLPETLNSSVVGWLY